MLGRNMGISSSHWWVTALRGLVAILFGIAAIFWPGVSLRVLAYLFGAYVLIDGIFSIVMAIQLYQFRSLWSFWWVLLLEGIAGIAAGVMAFIWPGITVYVLLMFIAIWAIVTGIFELMTLFTRGSGSMEWAMGIAGVLSILLGVILILQPGAGLLTMVWLIGAYAIAWGIMLIIRGFQMRSYTPSSLRDSSSLHY